jgi:6-phospho-beta-glucosidase
MGVKVAVVGAGSTYTPELVEGFALQQQRLPIDDLALLDVDGERLEVVGGLARRILKKRGWSGMLSLTTDRNQAFEGADFVVIQLRVGGQRARLIDETLPLEFGCIGQETTGAGGFAKALRTVPVVLEIAEEVGRRSAAHAWIIDFTNPVGIVTQALLDEGHRAIGLCNSAMGFERMIARHLSVEPSEVTLEHVGLNHLTWERAAKVKGKDRLPGLIAERAHELAVETQIPTDLIRTLGALPSYYLRYYYCTDQVLAEQLSGTKRSRAEEVIEIERALLAMYRDPQLEEKPPLLMRRGGAYYSEAAVRLITSLHAGTGDIQAVDARNQGGISNFADDAVVEVSSRIDREGAHPLRLAPLAPELKGLMEHVKAYERLTVQAAIHGDRRTALKALLSNPLVPSYRIAASLLDALLSANREHLSRFFAPA